MSNMFAKKKDIREELQNILEKFQNPSTFFVYSITEKNALTDAQAAVRILSNLNHPHRFIKLEGDSYERVLKPAASLDSPFVSDVQRMEDLSKLYIAAEYRNADAENKVFADSLDFSVPKNELTTKAYEELPQRIHNSKVTKDLKSYALDVLSSVSKKIKDEELRLQINDLVNAYGEYEPADVAEICYEIAKISNKNVKTLFGPAIENPMAPLVTKRTSQILSSLKQRRIVLGQKEYTRN